MNPRDLKRLSHYLSRVLRHQPRLAHLTLDPRGFAPLDGSRGFRRSRRLG